MFIRRFFADLSTVDVLSLGDILISVELLVSVVSAERQRKLQRLTVATVFQPSAETLRSSPETPKDDRYSHQK